MSERLVVTLYDARRCAKVVTKTVDKRSKKKQTSGPTTARWFLGSLFNLLRRFGSQVIWVTLLAYAVHSAAIVFIAYAGQTTNANLAIRIATHLNVAFAFSFSATGISAALYIREYKRHRVTRERLTARTKELELQIDPNRTSSLLTSQGLTKKEDL
jgi:hypothetical protein